MAATDLLSLAEARAALRLPASDTSRDADIATTYIPAVTALVEDIVGPVVQRSQTITTAGGTSAVLLEPSRLVSVTSVSDGGTTLAASDYAVDVAAGIVYRGGTTSRLCFLPGVNGVAITYIAGLAATTAAVPAPIKLAARIILANLWQGDQQGYRPEFGTPGDDSTVETPAGFTVPRQAYALLEPYALSSLPSFS